MLPTKLLGYDVTLQPQTPMGLKAEYDSVTGRVSLSWNTVTVSDLQKYVLVVYPKGFEGKTFENPITAGGASGMPLARYVDDWTVRYFFEPTERNFAAVGWSEASGGTLVYKVKSVDKAGNSSPYYSEPIEVRVSYPLILRTEGYAIKVIPGMDSAGCRDSVSFGISIAESGGGTFSADLLLLGVDTSGISNKVYRQSVSRTRVGDTAAFSWYSGKDTAPWQNFYDANPGPGTIEFVAEITVQTEGYWRQTKQVRLESVREGCYGIKDPDLP
ncbi:MAG: hypothetical protein ABIW76_04610 [Fibrobacteria bacterium]